MIKILLLLLAICSYSFQMFTVRLLGRLRSVDRRHSLRILTGIASGGCALTWALKHSRVHATTSLVSIPLPSSPSPSSIPTENKSVTVIDKFDWKVFWYYLKPQIWIIACATAVG